MLQVKLLLYYKGLDTVRSLQWLQICLIQVAQHLDSLVRRGASAQITDLALPRKLTVVPAVKNVDQNADYHPDNQPQPRVAGKGKHLRSGS